jgi:hypothetical protein
MRIISVGILTYTREELGAAIPPELSAEPAIRLFVSPEAISDPRSIRLLEGMPLTAGAHDWQDPTSNATQVGNIAGTPRVDGPYLVADALITEQTAAQMVIDRRLPEISAAYDMDIVWEPGEYGGELYHGRQTRLRYNHTTLLPGGKGRGGQEVRVLNEDPTTNEETAMTGTAAPAFTLVALPGGARVRVANEDADTVSKAVENAETEAKESTATAFNEQVAGLAEQLKLANEEKAAAEAKVAELNGQIQQMQEQLTSAMDPAAIEAKAEEMQNEQSEAAQVMNCKTLPDDLKSLRGHDLRAAVVTQCRAANSLPALSADELKDESGIRGRFSVMAETSGKTDARTKVPGAAASTSVRTQNAASSGNYGKDRFNTLYGKKEA